MSRSLVTYNIYDKTGDPSATARARYAPKFSAYLANLGFRPLGVLVALAKDSQQYAKTLRPRMSEPTV